jgi:hypothetical protein
MTSKGGFLDARLAGTRPLAVHPLKALRSQGKSFSALGAAAVAKAMAAKTRSTIQCDHLVSEI